MAFERQTEQQRLEGLAATSAEQEAAAEHQVQLAAIKTERLHVLERQIEFYGEHAAPAHLLMERDMLSEELERFHTEARRQQKKYSGFEPYLGLQTFQARDAKFFYGRDSLIEDLIDKVQDRQFLAVLGSSGSGKSSVVLAGLLPALADGRIEGSEGWLQLIMRPGPRPIDGLASALATIQGDPTAAVRYRKALSEGPAAISLVVETLLSLKHNERLVLVVDQFEETWTQASPDPDARKLLGDQQQTFIDLLLAAATTPDSPVLVVLTMRADFLHRAAEDRALAQAISENVLIVSNMSSNELRSAITEPAIDTGGNFEPGLVEELIEQVQDRPGCLPLLQYTLLELWQDRQDDGVMTWKTYQKIGGVQGALAQRAESILTKNYDARDTLPKLRSILLRLVQLGETADTRRRVRMEDIVPANDSLEHVYALLKPLIDGRMLTIGYDEQSLNAVGHDANESVVDGETHDDHTTVELSHEALIGGWPTMKRWIEEARADLQLQLRLGEAATEWEASGENADFLWGQSRLDAIQEWCDRSKLELTALDTRFIEASRRACEQQRQKEIQLALEQRAARRGRFLREAVGLALGSGFGYGLAMVYLAVSGPERQTTDAIVALFLAMFLPAATIGFCIGLALWVWSSNQSRMRPAATAIGTCVGFVCYAPLVIVSSIPEGLDLTTKLPNFAAGALLGLGLGLAIGFARNLKQRWLWLLLASVVAAAVGNLIGGFGYSFGSAIVAGAIIGGLTGLGSYVVSIE